MSPLTQRVAESLAIIREEVERLRGGQIDEAMFAASKKEVRCKCVQAAMDPDAVGVWYGSSEVGGFGVETVDEYCAAIDRLTPDDAARVAKKYFVPERRAIACMGDVDASAFSLA